MPVHNKNISFVIVFGGFYIVFSRYNFFFCVLFCSSMYMYLTSLLMVSCIPSSSYNCSFAKRKKKRKTITKEKYMFITITKYEWNDKNQRLFFLQLFQLIISYIFPHSTHSDDNMPQHWNVNHERYENMKTIRASTLIIIHE